MYFALGFFFINCSEPENIDIHLSLSEFEDQLLTHEGNNTSTSELDGKYLGIYFPSYYCPPCRDFTPKLVEFREKHADEFEVVFVSSDFEEDDQFNYIKEANMKFLTLPIDSNVSFHLSEKLGVEGIPSLAIVSPTGKVLTLKEPIILVIIQRTHFQIGNHLAKNNLTDFEIQL